MSVKFIKAEELGIELAAIIEEYTEDVSRAIEEEVDNTAKKVKETVAQLAPKNRPKYSKGFAVKKDDSGGSVNRIVYNKSLPGLVHLKEFGHRTRGIYRVKSQPHMRPAYDQHVPAMERRIESIIRNGG